MPERDAEEAAFDAFVDAAHPWDIAQVRLVFHWLAEEPNTLALFAVGCAGEAVRHAVRIEHERPELRLRPWSIDAVPADLDAQVVVDKAELATMTGLFEEMSNWCSLMTPGGFNYEDPVERTEVFGRAHECWNRAIDFMRRHGWD